MKTSPLTPAPGMVVRLSDVFATEIRDVRNLGCTLEVTTHDGVLGGTASARITPITPKATRGMRLAAHEDGAPGRKAIETRQAFGAPSEKLDALRAAIAHALDIARAALA